MSEPASLIPYRLRTVRVGVQATFFVVASLVAFALIPSGIRIDMGWYLLLLAAAALGAIFVAFLPWVALFEKGWGIQTMYAWSLLDILLITGILAAAGRDGSPLFVLYALTTVFASASYRPRVQVAMLLFTLVCYTGMLLVFHDGVIMASLVVRFSTLIGVAYITGFLSRELQSQNKELAKEMAVRESAQEKLLASQAQLEEAQRIAHLGYWEWDIPANKLNWSDELLRIFGLERDSFKADYDTYLELCHPDDRTWVNDIVTNAYESLEPFSYEHRILRSDGTERVVLARGSVVADENGKAIRMVGTALDLTDRKKAAEAEQALAELSSRQQQAMEINDSVVQGLTVAAYSLDGDDKERAEKAIRATLGAARKIVEKLLSGRLGEMKPGDLVRSAPARIEIEDDEGKGERGGR